MKWYTEKETRKICYSDGEFHTYTRDWNCDGDVYTDTVMIIHFFNNDYTVVHHSDINDYEEITEKYVYDFLKRELNDYFLSGGEYYCDPTYFGSHYGEYGFIKGGHCIYKPEVDRQNAIETEIKYIMKLGN